MNILQITKDAIELLKQLIETPSFSREESETADLIFNWLNHKGKNPKRHLNNVYAIANNAPKNAPVILLNSHHDTVKFGDGWLTDPFTPTVQGNKLIGLGSNDAGASAISLLATFHYLSSLPELPYQLIIAITAEEEISGRDGIESLLPLLPKIDLGIVGEPTEMKIAVSEKGLMVIDVEVKGKTGHAARNEGDNAIYKAMKDVAWFESYQFEKVSAFLGPMKMTVSQIEAGIQHNVIPDLCKLVIDVRLNDCYNHEETLNIIQKHIQGKATARSMRLKPSKIDLNHSLINHAKQLGFELFGSATMSDQALMPFTTIKLGPGVSERSHTPNEHILLSEIEHGILQYIALLERYQFT